MEQLEPRYSKEEFAQIGNELYDRVIRPQVETATNEGKYVLLDIETGEFEMDADEMAASDRLLARQPQAQIWMVKVGSSTARRFGGRSRSVAQ